MNIYSAFEAFSASANELYKILLEFVKEHQGTKGYINCQPALENDYIYGLGYDDEEGKGVEFYVYAVRATKGEDGEDLEILTEPICQSWRVVYSDDDFLSSNNVDKWYSLRWSDVYFIPTLYNIAESIEQYVEE